MILRKAIPKDIYAVCALAEEALSHVRTGDLLLSKERIKVIARRLVSDASSLVLVDEKVTGCIAIAVSDGMFFERKSAQVCFWYARDARTLVRLLREALGWCRQRPAIKAVWMEFFFESGERYARILERAGLHRRGSVFARY